MNSIIYKNLELSYENRIVLRDISLSLDLNIAQTICIHNSSLSGSTSLLKLIGGDILPTKGDIFIDGINQKIPTEEIGFVFEEGGLLHDIDIYKNIILGVKNQLYYDSYLFDELVNRFNIQDLLQLNINDVNDVQTRVVNIVRAILRKPKLLLLDELDGGMAENDVESAMQVILYFQKKLHFSIIITTVEGFDYRPFKKFNKYLLKNQFLKEII